MTSSLKDSSSTSNPYDEIYDIHPPRHKESFDRSANITDKATLDENAWTKITVKTVPDFMSDGGWIVEQSEMGIKSLRHPELTCRWSTGVSEPSLFAPSEISRKTLSSGASSSSNVILLGECRGCVAWGLPCDLQGRWECRAGEWCKADNDEGEHKMGGKREREDGKNGRLNPKKAMKAKIR